MKSVMTHQFSQVPKAEIQRSQFDRSHGYKTTFDAGYLVPVFIDEALPGDTMNLKLNAFARLATPIKPVMDNMMLDSFFFAVPYRLIWNNFQKFMGEQANPGDSTSYTVPQMTGPGAGVSLLVLCLIILGFPQESILLRSTLYGIGPIILSGMNGSVMKTFKLLSPLIKVTGPILMPITPTYLSVASERITLLLAFRGLKRAPTSPSRWVQRRPLFRIMLLLR